MKTARIPGCSISFGPIPRVGVAAITMLMASLVSPPDSRAQSTEAQETAQPSSVTLPDTHHTLRARTPRRSRGAAPFLEGDAWVTAPPLGSENIQANQDAGGAAQNETTIAINPDPLSVGNLVGGANDYRTGGSTCGFYTSPDEGATWSDGTLPEVDTDGDGTANFTEAGDPGVAFDGAGHAYFLCMNFNRNAAGAGIQLTQYVFKSFDDGQTWGPPVLAAGAPLANTDDKGHIAVDTGANSPHQGNVYVSFTRFNPNSHIRFNRSTDGANSFDGCPAACADQQINGLSGGVQGSNIAVGPNGRVWVAWVRDAGGGNADLLLDVSDDGGQTFGADLTLVTFPSIGNPGGPGVRPLVRVNSFPVIKAHPTDPNVVYAVWAENPAGTDDSDIRFRRCSYNSAGPSLTCGLTERVNDDVNPPGEFFSQFFPWMAVDPNDGSINIVWYDDRNDANRTDGTPLVDLLFASSTNEGASFSQNLRVSEGSSNVTTNFATPFFGDYNAIDAGGGVAFPFWTDSSGTAGPGGTDQDVYVAQVGGVNLVIAKSDDISPALAGGPLVYRIVVSNEGPNTATNVTVTDILPLQVTFVGNTDDCVLGGGNTLTCNLDSIAPGESVSFDINVTVDATAFAGGVTQIANSASVSADQADSNESDNTVQFLTLLGESADLRVTKDCKPDDTAKAGSKATCPIFIDNLGLSTARGVTLSDVHVASGPFTLPGFTSSQGMCTQSPAGTITCSLGNIDPGLANRVKVTVDVTTPKKLKMTVDVNDVASVESQTPDPNTANNQDEDSLRFRSRSAEMAGNP